MEVIISGIKEGHTHNIMMRQNMFFSSILTQSQSGSLGPELVTDGNFDSSVNWGLYPGVTISGGVCTFNTANIYTTLLNQAITDISSGPVFTIQFDICTYTAGFVRFCLGNTTLGNNTPTFSAKGHYSFDLSVNNPAITPEITFFDDDTPGSQMVIDNVSVKVK